MSETLLWLLYLLGAALAFGLVARLDFRIAPAMIAGTLVTALGWTALYFATAAEQRPPFWRVDLSLNLSFALIFAGVGAAVGQYVLWRGRER